LLEPPNVSRQSDGMTALTSSNLSVLTNDASANNNETTVTTTVTKGTLNLSLIASPMSSPGSVASDDSFNASHLSNRRLSTASTASQGRRKVYYRKTKRPDPEHLSMLNGLKEGENVLEFSVKTRRGGISKLECKLYLWEYDCRIVISDVDGKNNQKTKNRPPFL